MPTEIVIGLLGIISTIVGALVIRAKNKSLVETQKQLADTEAKRMKAEGELAAAKAEAEQQTAMARIAERQQSLLEAFKLSYDGFNTENLARWATVSALFSDVRAGEANIHNTLLQISAAMGEISAVQKLLPDLIKQASADAVKESASVVGAEIGAAMAREFAMKNAERKLQPFPDAEDKRWRDAFIVPTVPDVYIHKEPHFDDDAKLKKSCSRIAPEGETARLIEEPSIKAIAIYKIQDGVPCYGWLPDYSVRIGQPTSPQSA